MDGKINNKDISVKVMNPKTVHIDFTIPLVITIYK